MGIYVEIASFRSSMSRQLSQRASGYICLDNYYSDFYSPEPRTEPAVLARAPEPALAADIMLNPEDDVDFTNTDSADPPAAEYMEGAVGEAQINLPEAE